MRWQTGRRSTNVIDRRRMGLVGGGVGAIVITIVALLLGINPAQLLQTGEPPSTGVGGAPPPTDEASAFVSVVLGDTEDTWNALFNGSGDGATDLIASYVLRAIGGNGQR